MACLLLASAAAPASNAPSASRDIPSSFSESLALLLRSLSSGIEVDCALELPGACLPVPQDSMELLRDRSVSVLSALIPSLHATTCRHPDTVYATLHSLHFSPLKYTQSLFLLSFLDLITTKIFQRRAKKYPHYGHQMSVSFDRLEFFF